MQRLFCICVVVVGATLAFAQPDPTVNLRGSLVLVDTTPDSIPVSALSVAIYSPTTLANYRAQADQNGDFELTAVRPGHYMLEMEVPARLKTFTISGEEVSPADFQIRPDTLGPVRIVLSVKTTALTVNVDGSVGNASLTAVLAPDDEFLTPPHAQTSSPVRTGVAQFLFLPPGKYLVFVVDADLSGDIGTDAKLRDTLKNEAAAVEVFANENARANARYITRQAVEDGKRLIRESPQAAASAHDANLPPLRVRVSQGVLQRLLIHQIAPVYPRDARRNHIQGAVVMKALIGKDGNIKDLQVLSGPEELVPAATYAVQQWRYKPWIIDSEAVEVETIITVNFRLSE